MTRLDYHYRDRRRELARELADVPTPPPPPDLLDAIRRDIPADLGVASEPAPAAAPVPGRRWWRAPSLRLAASIAFVAVGAVVVLRVTDRADRRLYRLAEDPAEVATETRPVAPQDSYLRMRPPEEASEPGAPAERVASRNHGIESPVPSSANAAPPAPAAERPADVTIGLAGDAHRHDKDDGDASPEGEAAGKEIAETITVTAAAPMVDRFSMAAGRVVNEEVGRRADLGRAVRGGSPSTERLDAPARPSTGGTAAPNDAPAADMFFRSTGVNPFVDTREDRLSTFALDVDTGSWSIARSYLERGGLPPAEAIRVEEFVNAQQYDDPAPLRGEFTLVAEGAPSPFALCDDYRLLRFAVKGRELAARDRRPAVLTFVVDVSGSMAQENRIGLVKRALGLLLDELAWEDRVGLVVYGTRGRVVLEHSGDHDRIRRAIDSLQPEGSTNAEEGLRLGYDLAGRSYQSGWNNRVLLCSDGVANVGATGPESILERIGSEARRGIELTTVGFGMGNYNDALMEQLADRGDGRYHYVDTLDEARRIFRENLSGTLETIAMDAKAQIDFDPSVVERWRLLGYENRDVADRDFRNDRVDAGEIGAGHSATALYEIRLDPRARRNDTVGTLRLRWKSAATGNVEEAALTLRVRDLESSFAEASDNLRRAAVAAELAEILKQSYYAREASWRTLRVEAQRLEGGFAGEREGDALLGMIDRAGELSGERAEEIEDPNH